MSAVRLSVTAKLSLLFALFALLPAIAAGWNAWTATQRSEQLTLESFKVFALKLANEVDRKMAERYFDVQAFTLSDGVASADTDPERLVSVMNDHVARSAIYPLMIFVDTAGQILATNDRDARGRPINSRDLLGVNVSSEDWFQQISRGDFSKAMPFTAYPDEVAGGTVITEVYIDPRVVRAYPDELGAVIGFAAAVEREGEVIGYWYNTADLSTVEEVFESAYQVMSKQGLGTAELTLLDGSGLILIDFDPVTQGSEKVVATDAFLTRNLVYDGVEAAVRAVAGETGVIFATHSRKQLEQAAGFAHLAGVLGYPGMNWSVLVRASREQVSAESMAQRRQILVQSLLILVLAAVCGLLVGRRFASPLQGMSKVVDALARGDLRPRANITSGDEIGALAHGVNSVADSLSGAVKAIGDSAANLDHTARDLSDQARLVTGSASSTNARASNVAAATEEMSATLASVSGAANQSSASIQSVAAGTDEMTSTISEIAANAERARGITDTAVGSVETANEKVLRLSSASEEISRVIDVIIEIAEQTKLLALNATIEAARAGEAGKGFAVVASEVKDLAGQTNRATEEIRASINAIQSSTGSTVAEIGNIRSVIGDVSHIVSSIAAAVEQQSVTTRSIAGNIADSAALATEMNDNFKEASVASTDIASDVAAVTQSVSEIDAAIEQINTGARGLTSMSEKLRELIGSFQTGDH
ncbi:MAG: methyl-accepting chemotaxis protein [Pseudomonadota bacterium]